MLASRQQPALPRGVDGGISGGAIAGAGEQQPGDARDGEVIRTSLGRISQSKEADDYCVVLRRTDLGPEGALYPETGQVPCREAWGESSLVIRMNVRRR